MPLCILGYTADGARRLHCNDALFNRTGAEWTAAPTQFINFVVVSKTHSPTQIEAAVDTFLLETMPALIESTTEETFAEHLSSMIIKVLEPPKTLGSVDSALFTEISAGRKSWDRPAVIADALRHVAKEDVATLLNEPV